MCLESLGHLARLWPYSIPLGSRHTCGTPAVCNSACVRMGYQLKLSVTEEDLHKKQKQQLDITPALWTKAAAWAAPACILSSEIWPGLQVCQQRKQHSVKDRQHVPRGSPFKSCVLSCPNSCLEPSWILFVPGVISSVSGERSAGSGEWRMGECELANGGERVKR